MDTNNEQQEVEEVKPEPLIYIGRSIRACSDDELVEPIIKRDQTEY